jgi:hypothetical protein
MAGALGLEQIRDAFIEAWKDYTQQGNLMRDLLISHGALEPDSTLEEAIAAQQARLSAARRRYDRAQAEYVRAIVPPLVLPPVLVSPPTSLEYSPAD